jgi:hypothetical protein
MAGRGLVEEKFTSDAMMKRIVAKYDNLVAKSGVARPKNTTSGQ